MYFFKLYFYRYFHIQKQTNKTAGHKERKRKKSIQVRAVQKKYTLQYYSNINKAKPNSIKKINYSHS